MSALAVCAALLHALAYLLYLSGTLRRKVEPEPTSWLMWAYGTALVVVIETDQGIDPLLVILPVVCAACSIAVAFVCFKRGAPLWPSDGVDRGALGMDIALTLVYLVIGGGVGLGLFAERGAWSAKAVLLVVLGVSTVVSYVPTLRAVRRDPSREDGVAWSVWTIAYTLLLAVTIVAEGVRLSAIQFWIYPAVCAVLSGTVAWSAVGATRVRVRPLRYRPTPRSGIPPSGGVGVRVSVAPNPITSLSTNPTRTTAARTMPAVRPLLRRGTVTSRT